MLTENDARQAMGGTLYGPDGDKIGKIAQVYLNDSTGQPEFLTVTTGLFGNNESFVPAGDATIDGDDVTVPYSKDKVKDAPNVAADGHLEPDEEDQLYDYYGMGTTSASGPVDTAGTTNTGDGTDSTNGTDSADVTTSTTTTGSGDPAGAGYATNAPAGTADAATSDVDATGAPDDTYATDDRGDGYATDTGAGSGTGTGTDTGVDATAGGAATEGYDTSGPTTDEAMTRSEESLNVGTRTQEKGRARLRKYVTTEEQTVTVPVTKEYAVLTSEPITDDNADQALSGGDITEEEHEVVLNEEVPVVEKVVTPVERVSLGTESYTEDQQVTDEVRKEHVEVDGDVDDRRDNPA